ncbi:ankyrin repeat domain-containing protein [Hydrogenophaga sp.]|uniref:ankyrin repeat domain-containing protein n=1 Tax=Hydrogenophaga sp. TaxID=1904254 RepID=UPI0027244105|nr:ankyrin repeat domain-containing protein [Hydrogenophaga sp.]MDO9438576.1 ankyrin repeat domain-containing protein [Hydrogenophaga sp.]
MCNRLLHDAGVRRPADQEAWYQGLHVTMPASEGSTLTDLNHQATGLWIEDCATQLTTGMPGNAVQQRSTQSMSTLICNAAEKTLVIHDRAVLKADELDGFPPEEVTRIRSGLLLMHASENRVAEVRALVEVHGLDLSVQDTGGLTALHHACQKGNVDVARYILERSDKHIHERDKHGNTPLHAASRTQQIEVVQLLLAKKPLLDAVNQAGLTPLVAAKQVGYTTMVQLLRAAGASWA